MHRANIEAQNIPLFQIQNISEKNLQETLLQYKLHPRLKFTPEYYFDRFENITGELWVIGMSPNNDYHIINLIKRNPNITEVRFYCHSDNEKKVVQNIGDTRFKPMDVNELRTGLGVEAPKKYVYKFPPNSDQLLNVINAICTLSDYQATWEKIQQDIMSFPPFEIKRFCDEAFEKLRRHDAIHSSPEDITSFRRNFVYISHIATKEGILPPSLLMLLIMNLKKYT